MKTPKKPHRRGSPGARARHRLEVQTAVQLRRLRVATMLQEGVSIAAVARELGVGDATVRKDRDALLGQLTEDDDALEARVHMASKVALRALAELDDLERQSAARFVTPEPPSSRVLSPAEMAAAQRAIAESEARCTQNRDRIAEALRRVGAEPALDDLA